MFCPVTVSDGNFMWAIVGSHEKVDSNSLGVSVTGTCNIFIPLGALCTRSVCTLAQDDMREWPLSAKTQLTRCCVDMSLYNAGSTCHPPFIMVWYTNLYISRQRQQTSFKIQCNVTTWRNRNDCIILINCLEREIYTISQKSILTIYYLDINNPTADDLDIPLETKRIALSVLFHSTFP